MSSFVSQWTPKVVLTSISTVCATCSASTPKTVQQAIHQILQRQPTGTCRQSIYTWPWQTYWSVVNLSNQHQLLFTSSSFQESPHPPHTFLWLTMAFVYLLNFPICGQDSILLLVATWLFNLFKRGHIPSQGFIKCMNTISNCKLLFTIHTQLFL